ncbi:ABC transporter permease [Agromyces seonyuensis]|uniref:FtsX-like permease family protein n=1 Tax=Agromyces seonyuensis TaxID=2662446 RepID=A0A6I4P2Z0_9MICO|nr:ABC transporter permease [Agromyces seonyuensis]MWB99145.1 FtsX-like permease family protein [Agromyces seonyuensis]
MFVALRDLRFARGRFMLIGSVVALITILVGFLSGLTGGLAAQNVSAVLSVPADRLVFSGAPVGADAADAQPSFADSEVTAADAQAWAAIDGVSAVQPIGISQTRAEADGATSSIALFGELPGSGEGAPSRDGMLVLPRTVADDLSVSAGDGVRIGGAEYTVESIGDDRWYSHTPVVGMSLDDWQDFAAATGDPGAFATVLAVSGGADWEAAAAATGTQSTSILGSLLALSAFKSEIGSLLLMVAMLFGISALVIGAFFTVWTMQRSADIAVLKALGASTRSLVRDSLGQALVVLVAGIGIGLLVVWGLGALAGTALPFLLSPITTLLPGVLMAVVGLAGAAFALRSVTAADPLTALGSNR